MLCSTAREIDLVLLMPTLDKSCTRGEPPSLVKPTSGSSHTSSPSGTASIPSCSVERRAHQALAFLTSGPGRQHDSREAMAVQHRQVDELQQVAN